MNAPFSTETMHSAKPIADNALTDKDTRLAFLQRASARCVLVELNEIDIRQGFDELIAPFLEIVFPRPVNEAEAYWDHPGWRQAAIEHEDYRPENARLRPTPQATIDAIKHSVRERGTDALHEPSCRLWLQECDAQAVAELDKWLIERGAK